MALLGLSPYTWVMLAFFILLVLVLVLGDIGGVDFDHDIDAGVDTGVSPVSLPVVAVFGASFGGYGTLLEILDFGPIVVPILATAFAALTSGGAYLIMLNVFVKTQAETRVDLESLKGYKGQVLIPIRPGQPGQIVVVTEERGRTLLQAIADEAIGTDEHVVVDSAVGNSVKVHRA